MWEFSLNFKSENFEVAKFVYNTLKQNEIWLYVTSYEANGNISIVMAMEDKYIDSGKSMLAGLITEIICTKFKSDYLNRYLFLPILDKVGALAFKRALLNFDRETDKYLVKRALVFSGSLYVESFYSFRLQSLQQKWEELVHLANENREYLLSRDSFIDLLKFLVDNLDICENEIGIIKEGEGYRIINCENSFYTNKWLTEESVVSSVIDLSPQKINLYFQDSSYAINLLQRIFDERIIVNSEKCKIKSFKLS
ncbi:MAG: hypothetical protein E7379_01960 [Clostridiales bacterium]|nr:hypothetical protein [Clostridiales bacterium]